MMNEPHTGTGLPEDDWQGALIWARLNGWTIETALCYDEECIPGWILRDPNGVKRASWLDDGAESRTMTPAFDDQAYRAIQEQRDPTRTVTPADAKQEEFAEFVQRLMDEPRREGS
jgi:hypothetical protein